MRAPTPEPDADDPRTSPRAGRRLSARRVLLGVALTVTVLVAAGTLRDRGSSGSAADVDGANYRVRTGDTIESVADLHAVSAERLMDANDLTLSDSLPVDERIVVPDPPTEGREPPRALVGDPNKLGYAPAFARAAAANDLPPGLLEAVAWNRSGWVNAKVDEDGRTGLGQLPADIVEFANRELVDGPRLDPAVADDNIALSAAYLGHLLELSEGDRAAALVGYRYGDREPGRGVWSLDTVEFVRTVLGLAPDLEDLAPPTPTTSPSTSSG